MQAGFLVSHEGFELAAGYAWAGGQARVGHADTDVEINGAVADSYLGVPAGQAFTVDDTQHRRHRAVLTGGVHLSRRRRSRR